MRAVFGVLSLLIVVAVIGVLAKKQLGSLSSNAPAAAPAAATAGVNLPTTTPGANVAQQSQQIQQQTKQVMEATLQQARPMPDDK
jgi:Na+-transporting methylmalonyl-CoA/oxaloacetate decarboxylase gamma subunit